MLSSRIFTGRRIVWLAVLLILLGYYAVRSEAQVAARPAHPLLTGYFPQWGLYTEPKALVKNLVGTSSTAIMDQINYAQGFVTDGHCSVADPNADVNYRFSAEQSVDGIADGDGRGLKGYLGQMVKLKRRYPELKLILSLEGRANDFAEDAKPERREAFVASCIDLWVKGNIEPGMQLGRLFDGIDVDWEFPHEADAENYVELLKEFRRQMDAVRPGLMLNVAVGPSPRMYGGADMGKVAALVNQMGLMTYDFTGPWMKRTGFLSALSGSAGGTVQRTVDAYRAAGVPKEKMLVGVPFYGYGWRQVTEDNNGLFQEGEPIRGDRSYRDIERMVADSTLYRDPNSQAPWLFDGDIFWTYEDAISVKAKARYVVGAELGGLMIWELGEDATDGTLLKAARDGLREKADAVSAQAMSLR